MRRRLERLLRRPAPLLLLLLLGLLRLLELGTCWRLPHLSTCWQQLLFLLRLLSRLFPRSSSSFFLCSSMERSPAGQDVRLAM